MKTKFLRFAIVLALLTLVTLNSPLFTAWAQGTAFTYQGRLISGSAPASGNYDLMFALYDSDQPGGNLIAGPVTNSATVVSNGLFTTTIDFGAGVFTGGSDWLEIAVQTNGGGGFTTLGPRQQLTPTPYAITAENFSGVLPDSELPNFQPPYATIGGGENNTAGGSATVGGGLDNVASGTNATIAGGYFNTNSGSTATIGGGAQNAASGIYSTIGGGEANAAVDSFSMIAGGSQNIISSLSGEGSTIGGGYGNSINYVITSVSPFSYTSSSESTIGGGLGNVINGDYATIGGGYYNNVSADYTTVGGGDGNNASGGGATIGGGISNQSPGSESVVGGGRDNQANGQDSTVPGGLFNIAGGELSFAAGYHANANYNGSFVWADASTSLPFSDTGINQFRIRAMGGVQIISGGLAVTGTSSPNYPGTSGVYLENSGTAGDIYAFNYNNSTTMPLMLNSPGGNVGVGSTTPTHLFQVGSAYSDGTGWYTSSDRNIKSGFEGISVRSVLDKVAALPITRWHYTNDLASTHLGPMAQDFYAAFNIGPDDKHIGPIDEGGVALAAIQGLNEKVEARSQDAEASIRKLEAENAALKQSVAELKAMVNQLVAQK